MSDISALHAALVTRVLDGNGQAPASLRRAAFNNAGLDSPLRELVDKVVHQAYAVTAYFVSFAMPGYRPSGYCLVHRRSQT
jgi:hypothetical protein